MNLISIGILLTGLSVFANQDDVFYETTCEMVDFSIKVAGYDEHPSLNWARKFKQGLVSVRGDKGSAIMGTKITAENLGKLFSHEYRPGKYGAKALFSTLAYGKPDIVFWSTGEGAKATNYHHRDAVSFFLRLEAESQLYAAAVAEGLDASKEQLIENLGVEVWPYHANYRREANKLGHASNSIVQIAKEIATIRRTQSFTANHLIEFHGFQLTSDGRFITNLDYDSSLLTATKHHLKNNKVAFGDLVNPMVNAILGVDAQIPSSLKKYRNVGFKDLLEVDPKGRLQQALNQHQPRIALVPI